MPPSTFLRDKPRAEPKLGSIDEGTAEREQGKGKKGQQKGSKGKGDTKGKGEYVVKEMQNKQSDDAESSYTNQASQEKNWGLAEEHQKSERDNTNDDWIQVGCSWGEEL